MFIVRATSSSIQLFSRLKNGPFGEISCYTYGLLDVTVRWPTKPAILTRPLMRNWAFLTRKNSLIDVDILFRDRQGLRHMHTTRSIRQHQSNPLNQLQHPFTVSHRLLTSLTAQQNVRESARSVTIPHQLAGLQRFLRIRPFAYSPPLPSIDLPHKVCRPVLFT